jgi:hypothetical protein
MIRESNGLFSELGRKRYLRKFNQMFYKLYFHLSKKINYISIKTLHVSKKKQQNCTKKKVRLGMPSNQPTDLPPSLLTSKANLNLK